MHLTGLVPVLSCQSVDESLHFYQQTLQFVVIRTRQGDTGLEWAYLKSGNVTLMLEAHNDAPAKTGISLYFYIDDIRSFHQYMKAKAYDISPLEKTKYGLLQCFFNDPDGYLIQVGENLLNQKE